MIARDFMTKDVVTCKDSQTVAEAAKLMSEKGFSVVPIVDDSGKLVGIVTESDFVGKDVEIPHAMVSLKRVLGENHYHGNIEEIYARAKKRKLKEVMSTRLVTVEAEATLTAVVEQMTRKNLKRLPVVENGQIVGIVTRKDLIKAFNQMAEK